MLVKRVFNPLAVARYMRLELAMSTTLSSAVYFSYRHLAWRGVTVPFSIAAMLGSAIAIFIAFRNQSSYGRWWEARTAWGGVLNASRTFSRVVLSAEEAAAPSDEARVAFTRELVYRQIAFGHALRAHLRRERQEETLGGLLPPGELVRVARKQNVPNYLLLLQGRRVREGVRRGFLSDVDLLQLEPALTALNNLQGACERIKNTPMLRQYHFFTQLFLLGFTAVLPFALVADLDRVGMGRLLVPLVVTISFVFGVMAKVGEVNEDPFEGRVTDVPMTAISRTIERDLREMLGEAELPPRVALEDGVLS